MAFLLFIDFTSQFTFCQFTFLWAFNKGSRAASIIGMLPDLQSIQLMELREELLLKIIACMTTTEGGACCSAAAA